MKSKTITCSSLVPFFTNSNSKVSKTRLKFSGGTNLHYTKINSSKEEDEERKREKYS